MPTLLLGVLPPATTVDFLNEVGETASGRAEVPAATLVEQTFAFPFTETFSLADDSAWPAPWVVLGGSPTATVQEGEGEFTAASGTEGRIGITHTALQAVVAEIRIQVRFAGIANQGFWLWLRQNGGYRTGTSPAGQGYGMLLQGGAPGATQVEHWTELAGVLVPRDSSAAIPTITDGVAYNVKFHAEQTDASTTTLRSRIWATQTAEPATWNLETARTDAVLQNLAGGMAVGVQNYNGFSGAIRID